MKPGWLSLSIDGSAFDSTQYHQLHKCIDVPFWKGLKEYVVKAMRSAGFYYPKKSAEKMIKQITRQETYIFANIPNIHGPAWNRKIRAAFYATQEKKIPHPEKHWICIPIKGTTFSGDPVKTTLGNTLRTMAYAYHYAEMLGIRNPWTDDRLFVMAAGDD